MEKPFIPQPHPYRMEVEQGIYAWCACGLSSKQPYCDGSHKTTTFNPVVVTISEKKQVSWCGCKHTNNKPFCDGSHAKF